MKQRFPIILIVICSAVFIAGLVWLFQLRFESGDVYPEYSSLRADPLGTMAYFESLEKLPGMTVRRDFSTDNRLPEEKGVTYLHLASERYELDWLPEAIVDEIEGFVLRGGRLVITYYPQPETNRYVFDFEEQSRDSENEKDAQRKHRRAVKTRKPSDSNNETNAEPRSDLEPEPKTGPESKSDSKAKSDSKKKKDAKKKSLKELEEEESRQMSLQKRWGFGSKVIGLKRGKDDVYEAATVTNLSVNSLPATLDWHSGIVFTNLAKHWHAIYSRGTNAVVIERKMGGGSVVIATDSYFVSNEAMLEDRQPALLAWLIGPGHEVVFDEAHLGIAEQPGVATLMHKYRLQALVGGFILLVALFIWKNATSLVPPMDVRKKQIYVTGKDATAGFVNLLRRNIATRQLLDTCFAEWLKSAATRDPHAAARAREAQAVLLAENAKPARDRNLVQAYHSIAAILNRRKG